MMFIFDNIALWKIVKYSQTCVVNSEWSVKWIKSYNIANLWKRYLVHFWMLTHELFPTQFLFFFFFLSEEMYMFVQCWSQSTFEAPTWLISQRLHKPFQTRFLNVFLCICPMLHSLCMYQCKRNFQFSYTFEEFQVQVWTFEDQTIVHIAHEKKKNMPRPWE
jgi:hypothetical protein